MSERNMTVTEAARHFADLVSRTYYQGESTVLTRAGEPVAMMVPVAGASVLGRDWLARWKAMPHLEPEDADEFAAEVAAAREALGPVSVPWD